MPFFISIYLRGAALCHSWLRSDKPALLFHIILSSETGQCPLERAAFTTWQDVQCLTRVLLAPKQEVILRQQQFPKLMSYLLIQRSTWIVLLRWRRETVYADISIPYTQADLQVCMQFTSGLYDSSIIFILGELGIHWLLICIRGRAGRCVLT